MSRPPPRSARDGRGPVFTPRGAGESPLLGETWLTSGRASELWGMRRRRDTELSVDADGGRQGAAREGRIRRAGSAVDG